MKKIIHHIRNKPDHVRSRFVIGFAVVATLLVTGLWVLVLRLTQVSPDDVIKTDSPFKVFGHLFSKSIDTAKQNYTDQKENMNTIITDTSTQPSDNNSFTIPDESSPVDTLPVPIKSTTTP
jgi:hypothetical protein